MITSLKIKYARLDDKDDDGGGMVLVWTMKMMKSVVIVAMNEMLNFLNDLSHVLLFRPMAGQSVATIAKKILCFLLFVKNQLGCVHC